MTEFQEWVRTFDSSSRSYTYNPEMRDMDTCAVSLAVWGSVVESVSRKIGRAHKEPISMFDYLYSHHTSIYAVY